MDLVESMNSRKVGLISIATNDYLGYWKELVKSAADFFVDSDSLNFYLFTNELENAKTFCRGFKQFNFNINEIPNYGWPDASLLRYKIITENSLNITDEILVWIDSDMLFVNKFDFENAVIQHQDEMHFVLHPGFYRPKQRFYKIKTYIHPKLLFRDFVLYMKYGGLGTWERSKKSSAFVARARRKSYACGGIWFGKNSVFKQFCSSMNTKVDFDSQNGYTAIWHDESYLNQFVAYNNVVLITPSLCFDSYFKGLDGIQPIIIAVRK